MLIIAYLSLYSQDDDTALRWAAYNNNVDLLKMILDLTIDIDVRNKVSVIKTTIVLITIPCTRLNF